jgi:hypothetical protein
MTSLKSPPTWNLYKERFHELLPTYERAYDVAQQLVEADWDGMSNVLLFAPRGFPLGLLMNWIMTQKFGNIKRSLHMHDDMPFAETHNYFDIDLLDPAIKTIDPVVDFVHTIISRSNILNQRHIFILQNIDALENHRYAFRVLFERFAKNVVFFCTTTRIGCIEPPLRSRFCICTIPCLTCEEISHTMHVLGKNVSLLLTNSRNIMQVILVSDLKPEIVTKEMCQLNYPLLAPFMNKVRTGIQIEDIRAMAFKLCSLNFAFTDITTDILQCFTNDEQKHQFITEASKIDHMLIQTNGGRKPLYYETLLFAAYKACRQSTDALTLLQPVKKTTVRRSSKTKKATNE